MTPRARAGAGRHYIAQGERAIGGDPDMVITAILGSCVAVCLHDPMSRIGGMNHILLPEPEGASGSGAYLFGAAAMEFLINDLRKAGAHGDGLRAKIFGGAAMLGAVSDVGARNVAFVQSFLAREGIPTDAASTGGSAARQIRFWPSSGKAHQRLVRSAPKEAPPAVRPVANGVELF